MQTTTLASLEDEVRELIRRRRLDPARDDTAVRQLVREAVADYEERALLGGLAPLADPDETGRLVMDSVAGFGPLQPYLDDPSIEEIWINEPSKVFVARHGRSELTPTFLTEQQVHDLVERMLRTSGRRVDLSSPFVDASLPDGSRLHVVIPDITRRHWAVNIRKFVVAADELDDLVRLGTLTHQAARFLEAAVQAGLNVLVAGGTQAGKTTMLNCLAAAIPPQERVVTCEEVFELPRTRLRHTTRARGPPMTTTDKPIIQEYAGSTDIRPEELAAQPTVVGHRLSLPCTTWCTYQDETEDLCAGQEHRVPLSRHDRERVFGQEGEAAWADDYVTTYALHDRLSRLSYVFLGHGEAGGMELTPAEARQLAVELVEVASQLDGADDRPARIRAVRIAAVLTTTLDAAGIGTTEAAAALDMPEREAVMVLADLASQRLEYLHRLAVAAGTRLSDVVAEAEAMEGQ